MISKTKLFLIGYFLPSWIASLMMWGDDRTSADFAAAPPWFYYVKFLFQIGAILLLFIPLRLRQRPALLTIALAIGIIAALSLAKPLLEAEYLLINSSIQIAVLAIFLSFAEPKATIERSDIGMFYGLLLGGFALQITLFLGFGRLPSHSISDLIVRFNGITNDSLAAGMLLPLFIPWAAAGRYRIAKTVAVMAAAVSTGSLFSAVFVPVATVIYLLYRRLYRFAAIIIAIMAAGGVYFYSLFSAIIEIKFLSILTHLRFFLNLGGVQYEQPQTTCAEEFCESFIESGIYLSPVYLVLFYLFMFSFMFAILRSSRQARSPLLFDTLLIHGAALIVGCFVHPVPIIPFAVPMFMIMTSLYLNSRGLVPGRRPAALRNARALT